MATTVVTPARGTSFVEWGPIIAGSVLACATSFVLTKFGQGIGFTIDALNEDTVNLPMRLFMVGLWVLWVQLMASMGGAYLAGRLRAPVSTGHESEVRDGAHGLLVWATSTLMVLAAAAVASIVAAAHGVTIEEPRFSEEMQAKINAIWGFSLAAISLVSAAAAWWMGTLGGDHRDNAIDASRYISFRKRTVVKK